MSEKKKPLIYFEQGLETIFEVLCIEPKRADYLLELGIKLLFENVFGLGAVERQPVRWRNCAKPVLPAGTVNLVGCLIGMLKKSF